KTLEELLLLPPEQRDKCVPLLLKHSKRFEGESEYCWIIERLEPHFTPHQKLIDPVLRAGLKSEYVFAPSSVLELLEKIGPPAADLVPDVLAYIGRQRAFSAEQPHLVHIEPEGKTAIPGLIRLLRSRKDEVRYSAARELAAYGPRA